MLEFASAETAQDLVWSIADNLAHQRLRDHQPFRGRVIGGRQADDVVLDVGMNRDRGVAD